MFERIVEALEPDPTLQQHAGQLNQVPQGAPEAVELPDHQDIARAQLTEHGLQHRALDADPARHLLVDLPTAGAAQGIDLQVQALVFGADTGIADVHPPLLTDSCGFDVLIEA